MAYELDTSAWPIVLFRFIDRLDQSDCDRYFLDCDTLVAGPRSYVCVMDGTRMLAPDGTFVRRQALWIREHRVLMMEVNRGIAFVVPSALVRGLVSAVLYFQELPVPHASFAQLQDALKWARARC